LRTGPPGARATVALALALASAGCAGRGVEQRIETVPASPSPSAEVADPARPAEPSDDEPSRAGVYHEVERGQTLWRIAKVYGVDIETLAAANGIADTTRLETGALLFVPGARSVLRVPAYPAPLDLVEPGPADAAPPSTHPASADWTWPVDGGEVISAYGAPRRGHRHRGIDIRGRQGQPVLAARGGRVSYSGSGMSGYGKTVIIDHEDGLRTLYAHNSALLVERGQRVERGQTIARVGRSGNATGVHCHFEIQRDDRAVDPMPYLAADREARR